MRPGARPPGPRSGSNRRSSQGLAVAALALAAGCGGQAPPPEAPPSISPPDEAGAEIVGIPLPLLPADVDPLEAPIVAGWSAVEATLLMPTPRPPEGDAGTVEAWVEEGLTPWLTRRGGALVEAQHALDIARQGAAGPSAVASALLGLAYERFALDLRGLPSPEAFARSAEGEAAYRRALERAASPLWRRALDAFGSCASVAAGAPAHSLDRWRRFCDDAVARIDDVLRRSEVAADPSPPAASGGPATR